MRERLAGARDAVPALAAGPRTPTASTASPPSAGWPLVLKAVARRLRRQGRAGAATGPTPRMARRASCSARATPLMAEQAVPMRRELAVLVARVARTGRRRRGRWWRRCSATGIASRSSPRRPAWTRSTAAAAATASALRIADELDVTGLLAVELFETDGTAGACSSTSSRCARTTPGTGRSRARVTVAVRAAPAGRARLPARRDASRRRRWSSWRTCSAARRPTTCTRRAAAPSLRPVPGVKVHLYGKAERPAARSGTSPSLGDDLDERAGAGRARRAVAARPATWADGWSPGHARGRPRPRPRLTRRAVRPGLSRWSA